MSNNYKVTSPPTSSAASSYQYNNYASGYPNYAYNGHEMTEYSRSNSNGRSLGTGNKVSSSSRSGGGNDGRGHTGRTGPGAAYDDDDEEEYSRGQWGSKAEFILSCVGFSVGIGNVWRFPYLAYQNGGSAFLVPYIILLVFVGKPMYYMETAMGQYSRSSPLQLWRCAPLAKGVGFAMIILSLVVSIYYNVIMAYSVIYVGASIVGIFGELPWTVCDEWWGADSNCVATAANTSEKEFLHMKRCRPNLPDPITENCTYAQSSASQFWEKYVLNITDGLHEFGDIGSFKWDLSLALLFSWIIVFLCLMKGVKSSGKVVYFTATFPYVILIVLLVRGCLLPGAGEGLKYLFFPRMEELLKIGPWRKAAEQMFFSLGLSWGGLIMFGSYNKFNNKIHIDAFFVSLLDFLTSLIASCVIFSVLGFMAQDFNISVERLGEVMTGGPGLAFIIYPEALSRLFLPWLWSILFFFMLFLLGLDSEFALLETALTALYDGVPRFRNHKVKTTFVACVCCYLLGLPCVSRSGQFVLDLMDTYGAGFAVLWTGFWELVGLMWIYGVCNVSKDIKLMLGSEPGWFWKITWAVISPLALLIIFVAALVRMGYEEHKYSGLIPYPDWAHYIGYGLVAISAVQIPLWAVLMSLYYLIRGRPLQVVKPTASWGPGDKAVKRAIQDEQNGIARTSKYSYDNEAMPYQYRM